MYSSSKDTCAICLEGLSCCPDQGVEVENARVMWLFCGHSFHEACFQALGSCPVCRAPATGLRACAENLDEHNASVQKFAPWDWEELFDERATHRVAADINSSVDGLSSVFEGQRLIITKKIGSWVEVLMRNGSSTTVALSDLHAQPCEDVCDAASHEVIFDWTKLEADAWDPEHKDDYIDLYQGNQVRLLDLTADGWASVSFGGLLGWLPFDRLTSLSRPAKNHSSDLY